PSSLLAAYWLETRAFLSSHAPWSWLVAVVFSVAGVAAAVRRRVSFSVARKIGGKAGRPHPHPGSLPASAISPRSRASNEGNDRQPQKEGCESRRRDGPRRRDGGRRRRHQAQQPQRDAAA